MQKNGPPASCTAEMAYAAQKRRNPKPASIHVRLPPDLLRRVQTAQGNIRLSPDQGRTPEDYYHGGFSAIIRLLLTIGLDTFEQGVSPRKGKTG